MMQAGEHTLNYQRIEKAILFMLTHVREQPRLEAVAAHVRLSAFHFQRMFIEWAGISPERFLSFLTIEYARELLREKQLSLFDTAAGVGLSGTGRLHHLFVSIEGMTPAEYRSGGKGLQINYSRAETVFGPVLLGATPGGLCYMAFTGTGQGEPDQLREMFPGAVLRQQMDDHQRAALGPIGDMHAGLREIRLHLKGTPFQLKVWNALLKIPEGALSSYGRIGTEIGSPAASRAVGSAIAANPVAFLIPCHRVVQGTGHYGDYRWGAARKKLMIGWEAARLENNSHNLQDGIA